MYKNFTIIVINFWVTGQEFGIREEAQQTIEIRSGFDGNDHSRN